MTEVWSASTTFKLNEYKQVHQFDMALNTKNFFVTNVIEEKPKESNFSENPIVSGERSSKQELIFAGID